MKRFFLVFTSILLFFTSLVYAQPSANIKAFNHSPIVLLKTNLGNIKLELFSEKAPKTVTNFLQYVRSGHYDGTIFHRVIPNFMIQGGAYTPALQEKPTLAPIALESQNGLKNQAGTIAMARTSNPNSATDQFFINTVNNPGLDYPNPDGYGYAVFGKVIEGMDVVKKIEHVNTQSVKGMNDVPTQPVIIESAKLIS